MNTSAAARSASVRPPDAGQSLAGQGHRAGAIAATAAAAPAAGPPAFASAMPGRGGHGLRLAGPSTATTSAATTAGAGALGLLVRHFGHRQVLAVVGDAAPGARALLDARELDDVGEQVGDLDEVGAGVAAEADDLDADALLLDGADGRGEVAVAGHDDGDVEVPGGLHHVDDELDVEVRLDLAVAVLADVLAHDLVVAAAQEVVEVALVLVVRIEAGIGVGAHEVAARGGRLEQRDVVDVHAGGLGRIEDVRHVYEDGDVLAHRYSLGLGVPSGRRDHAARRDGHEGRRAAAPAAVTVRCSRGPAGAEPESFQARPLHRIVRLDRLDDGAALVAGRSKQLLDEGFGDAIGVVAGIDDQEVDGPDDSRRR